MHEREKVREEKENRTCKLRAKRTGEMGHEIYVNNDITYKLLQLKRQFINTDRYRVEKFNSP